MGSHSKTVSIAALQAAVDAIKAITDVLPDAGALSDLATILTAVDTEVADILTDTATTIPGTITTLQSAVTAITAAGPTKTEMDTAHALLATPAQVATALNTYDAIKRSEATSDKDAVIAAIPAMVGTNGAALASVWTSALATILANYTAARAGYLDELAAANIPADVDTLKTYCDILDNATNGLAAIKAEVEGLAGSAMVGTDSAALASVLGAAVGATISADIAAVKAVADAIPTTAMRGTDSALLAANYTAERGTNNAATEAKQDTMQIAIDAITGAVSTDWKGSFNWDTSAYTTGEQDISALFSTNLTLTTRRKYSVKLDLTTVEADASFDELYLAVKEKIDGTNYRAIDRKTITKAQIAAVAEPGIPIDIPASSENIQITMKMKTALAGDATIYYAVVKEHLE